MISKELLSAILGEEVIEVKKEDTKIYFKLSSHVDYIFRCVDIFSLQIMIKSWALKQYDIKLRSCLYNDAMYGVNGAVEIVNQDISIQAESEPEAIFKAGQWVLENK